MARLANQAALGFVPLPDDAAAMIATYMSTANHPVRIFDPCAGEGVAIATIASALSVTRPHIFVNELNDARAQACADISDHVTSCDTLKALQATRNGFQLAFINPPFDHDGKEEGGGRLEPKFFHRCMEDGHWVQPGGLVVIVTPQDILQRKDSAKHLARCYDHLQVYALPSDIRRYREAVVFGVVRDKWRAGAEQYDELERIQLLLLGDLPELSYQGEPTYMLPMPTALRKALTWRDGATFSPEQAQHDVVETGGAWQSHAYRAQRASMRRERLLPVFPLHPAQAALRIASGEIDDREVELYGKAQLLKGSTREEAVQWTVNRETASSTVAETHTITRQVPQVVTVDDEGVLRMFLGDKGMAQLMSDSKTADALLQAVEEASPPMYALDMPDEVRVVLDGIVSQTGRALPGYKPGMLPMQQHVAAAAHCALTSPDPSQNFRVPKAVIIAAEMGTGKTTMGAATAAIFEALEGTRPRKRRRR